MKIEQSSTRLAQSASVVIDRCSCGNSFYLHIGGVAMRLPESALHEVYETLGEALVRQAMEDGTDVLRPVDLQRN